MDASTVPGHIVARFGATILHSVTKLSETQYRHIGPTTLAAILFAAFLGSASTCADISEPPSSPGGVDCVVDAECTDEEACFDGFCTTTCVTDEDCSGGICRAELRADQNDVVDVCVDDGLNNTSEMECAEDSECVERFDGDARARCGIDGTCFLPQVETALLIRDTTAVDPQSQPLDGGLGADIAAIYLVDAQTNEPVAWADTLRVMPANDVAAQNVPDGSGRALSDDGMCVDAPFETAATPLGGDGGYLLVRFLEGQTGDLVSTSPESWNVVIVEWGENCPDGDVGDQDTFEVFGCESRSHKTLDVETDCQNILGSGSGLVEIAATDTKQK